MSNEKGGEEILHFNKDDVLRGEFKLGDVHRRDRFEIKDASFAVKIELIVITRLGVTWLSGMEKVVFRLLECD